MIKIHTSEQSDRQRKASALGHVRKCEASLALSLIGRSNGMHEATELDPTPFHCVKRPKNPGRESLHALIASCKGYFDSKTGLDF